jgi:hypothetical protein
MLQQILFFRELGMPLGDIQGFEFDNLKLNRLALTSFYTKRKVGWASSHRSIVSIKAVPG